MLCCRDGSFYAGAAKDLAARLRHHEAGKASRYTRARRPVRLVWSRRVRTWSHALRTEHRLKQLSRAEKERLVAGAAWRIGGKPAAPGATATLRGARG
jgi:putative endonuclease